ncbi:MAG: hypothetical protein K2W82_08945 [Candidatus Obscuribacterales bacterium]|nr:hypothetical protein [Candidatus Obscuribacterales bacterium]
MQVRLFQAHPKMSGLKIEGPCRVVAHNQTVSVSAVCTLRVENNQLLLLSKAQECLLKARSLQVTGSSARGLAIRLSDGRVRHYRGNIILSLDKSGALAAINQVSPRDYLLSVVGSESLPDFPLEALKAQAVLTQTRLARYKPGDYLTDTTNDEAYLGADYERPLVRQAVMKVWGQKLCFGGRPIEIFYHAACAGSTSDARLFGGKNYPQYYQSVVCNHCRKSPFWQTKKTILPIDSLGQEFNALPQIGLTDKAGRPLVLSFPNGHSISGYSFWLRLGQKSGWDKVPGTRFTLKAERMGKVFLSSTGAGHGVGMCQWGAAELARQGKDYKQILAYYFPKCRLSF